MAKHTLPLLLAAGACWLAVNACSSPAITGAGSGNDKTGGAGGNKGGSGQGGGQGSGDGAGGLVLDLPDASTIDSGVPPKECMKQVLTPARVQPELLLALDRSSSMNASVTPGGDDGTPPTRWTETLAGLDAVLKATEATIPWGLRMFPEPGGCNVAPTLDTPIAANGAAAIMAMARGKGYNSSGDTGTPTNVVMQKAVEDLKALGTAAPKYIVLATDGEPTCPKMPGAPEGTAKAAQLAAAVQAVKDAVTAGYKTFVLGIAIDPTLKQALDQLADAGGFPRQGADTRYYPVTSKEDVVTALTTITTQFVASCTFTLQPPAPEPKLVSVSNGAEMIPQDAANGWTFADPLHIVLHGAACDAFKKAPNPSLKVTVACIFE
jgi:hypothetical protein